MRENLTYKLDEKKAKAQNLYLLAEKWDVVGKLEQFFNGGNITMRDDYRIVMALTVAGLVAGDTTIDTAESIFISYPNFFDDMRSIGANVLVSQE